MPVDLLLRNAVLPRSTSPVDLAVTDGFLVEPDGTAARETVDLGGRLVTPPLVEPHIHLDAVLTAGQPRPNVSGSLFEGIAVWAERVRDLTVEDVQRRGGRGVGWAVSPRGQAGGGHAQLFGPPPTPPPAPLELPQQGPRPL